LGTTNSFGAGMYTISILFLGHAWALFRGHGFPSVPKIFKNTKYSGLAKRKQNHDLVVIKLQPYFIPTPSFFFFFFKIVCFIAYRPNDCFQTNLKKYLNNVIKIESSEIKWEKKVLLEAGSKPAEQEEKSTCLSNEYRICLKFVLGRKKCVENIRNEIRSFVRSDEMLA